MGFYGFSLGWVVAVEISVAVEIGVAMGLGFWVLDSCLQVSLEVAGERCKTASAQYHSFIVK